MNWLNFPAVTRWALSPPPPVAAISVRRPQFSRSAAWDDRRRGSCCFSGEKLKRHWAAGRVHRSVGRGAGMERLLVAGPDVRRGQRRRPCFALVYDAAQRSYLAGQRRVCDRSGWDDRSRSSKYAAAASCWCLSATGSNVSCKPCPRKLLTSSLRCNRPGSLGTNARRVAGETRRLSRISSSSAAVSRTDAIRGAGCWAGPG